MTCQFAGGDHLRGWIIIPNLVAISSYWIFCAFFIALDMLPKTNFIRKYKVQPSTNDPLEMDKLPSVIKQVLFNQFCVQIPFSIISHPVIYLFGTDDGDYIRPIPTAKRIVLDLIVFEITREIAFYYIHRLLHHPRFYKKYHKMHHGKPDICKSALQRILLLLPFLRMDIPNSHHRSILPSSRTCHHKFVPCHCRPFPNGSTMLFCRHMVSAFDV